MRPYSWGNPEFPKNAMKKLGNIAVLVYHVNIISAGFNTTGKKKWLTTIVHSGYIAWKVVICHCQGTAVAPAIIIPVHTKQKRNVHLKRLSSRGSSSKKDVFSTSFEVAPQVMSISKKWQRRAWDTCREIPPRKTVRSGSHLKFSKTGRCQMAVGTGRMKELTSSQKTLLW